MPAVTVDDILTLPRLREPDPAAAVQRPVTSVTTAPRGFEGEGRRLARDLGVRVVGPLDGMRPAQLHGAQAVLILGR